MELVNLKMEEDTRWAAWLHLANEAHEAELFGIRALARLLKTNRFSKSFSLVLEEQLEDEVRHARGYAEFVKASRLPDSGFSECLELVMARLPCATLKLFLIQGLIEGLNLGLLKHRLETWGEYPTRILEATAFEEEQRHTHNSYPFMHELQCLDGLVPDHDFDAVFRTTLGLFARKTECRSNELFIKASRAWSNGGENGIKAGGSASRSMSRLAIRTMGKSRIGFLDVYGQSVNNVA